MPKARGPHNLAANDVRPRTSHGRLEAREDSPRPAEHLSISKTHAGAGAERIEFSCGQGDRCTHRLAQRATANGVLRARRMRATPCNSGRDVIDHDVDESVVTDLICNLAERIAAARQRIA